MIAWRVALLLVLLLLIALPLALPFVELARAGQLSWSADDLRRLSFFAVNTLVLVAGVLALAMPLGIVLAALLERTNLPLRVVGRVLTVACLFVPLPVLVSAWEGILGQGGWLGWWTAGGARPWASGMLPAIWVQALAALPWVVLIVGIGLRGVERELEEDALLADPPGRVLWRVSFRRAGGSILGAALFVALQTAGDISVTDPFQVATFAEEVHLQFALGQRDALARALAVNLPWAALLALFLAWALPRLERSAPPWLGLGKPALEFPVVRGRGWWLTLVVVALLVLALLPLFSLGWKLGQVGGGWSGRDAWRHGANHFRLFGGAVLLMCGVAVLTGLLATCLAFLAAWTVQGSRWFSSLLFVLLVLAWAMPGPVAGLGLKEVILQVSRTWPDSLLTVWLFDDSPLPILWGHVLRFFPVALVLLWPMVRRTPRERSEALRLEGATSWQLLRLAIFPHCRSCFYLSIVVVTALCLGEVAVASRVETPGWESFAKLLFDRMHYGFDNNVAALALVLLVEMGAVILLVWGLVRWIGGGAGHEFNHENTKR